MTTRPAPILICDDEAHIRHVLTVKLAEAGHPTLCAADGEEGWALAEAYRPAVVVTDVKMPRLDGLALARRLRDRLDPAPALVLLTGQGATLTADALDGLTVAAQFGKPFSPRELVRCVRDLIAAPSAPGGAA
ncbi:MAG: response regulator [Planctomycetota bacterium]